MTIPELIPCASSNVRARAWEDNTLWVSFIGRGGKPDSIYSYADVPQQIWVEWLRAPSVGQYFSQFIKGKFTATKIQ